jgi:alpha-tubulin suppressor-like RCC1 family protein
MHRIRARIAALVLSAASACGASAAPVAVAPPVSEAPRARPDVPGRTGAIGVGFATACSIDDGVARCWGDGSYGQLGDAASSYATSPRVVPGTSELVQISPGSMATCARRRDGQVVCWGASHGDSSEHLAPTPIAELDAASAIAVGDGFACAVQRGHVLCWGRNDHGELGGASTSRTPTPIAGIDDAVDVDCNAAYACAIRSDGSVVCWGSNAYGQIGNGTSGNDPTPPTRVVNVAHAVEIELAIDYACARTSEQTIWCWGSNGQNGRGGGEDASPATTVDWLHDVVDIAVGEFTCVTRAGGAVVCWGNDPDPNATGATTEHPDLATATEIDGGDFLACARLGDGSVHCMGLNTRGQVGDGTSTERPIAAEVAGLDDAVSIAATETYVCVARRTGELACWGADDGATPQGYDHFAGWEHFTTVPDVTGVVAVAASQGTCVLHADGSVACCGMHGGCDRFAMTAIAGFDHAREIAVDGTALCARVDGGTVRCDRWWLDGACAGAAHGREVRDVARLRGVTALASAGCASTADGTSCWRPPAAGHASCPPAPLAGAADATSVASFQDSYCALAASGEVRCATAEGEGEAMFRTEPTTVLTDAIDVCVGAWFGCAVRRDGSVVCFGHGDDGQLGAGSFASSTTPVAVVGVSGAVEVACGVAHACARLGDGHVWCWGDDRTGQLGDAPPDD